MAQTPEGRVKAKIKARLKAAGLWFFMPVAGPFGRHGIPDFIAMLPDGRLLAIEAKAPGCRFQLTDIQARTLSEIVAHGGIAVCVDDAAQLDEVLPCG